MNNLLSYCGLVDAKIRASDKDLLVIFIISYISIFLIFLLEVLEENTDNDNVMGDITTSDENEQKTRRRSKRAKID